MGDRLPAAARGLPAGEHDRRRWHTLGREGRYKGVAQFLKYVTSTKNQAWWAAVTGYLPLTHAAVKAMEASGHYAKNPHQKTAVDQMNKVKTTPNSQGTRLGNSVAVRDAIEEQMELIFSGAKTPQQGLGDAVAKGNEILKEFAARHTKVRE